MYGLHEPIPGGSEYVIEYDGPKTKEVITIYLPPVGYTIDRMPNPETGIPSYELIKCEILGEKLPIEDQKWIRTRLPKDWDKWRDEETRQQRFDKEWVHPEAERFRAREWNRRVNGVWQAIGNRNGKPTEYVYIPPTAYYYFTWWNPDFGFPKFRCVYLKTLLSLQWAEDHPLVRGITLSTHRRHGKTSIAGCWTVDLPSRMDFGYGGMQGQAGKKALEFFDIHLMQPFRRMVDFFQPKFDPMASQKSQLLFTKPAPRSLKKQQEYLLDEDNKYLGGRITCVSSSETALDGKKLHRIWLDECFAYGTKILCEGFIFRPIEEIHVGDKVIVEGGDLVEVGQTCQGEDEMYLVHQPYGKDYVVSSLHKLYLTRNNEIIEITPVEYLALSTEGKSALRRVTSKSFYKKTNSDENIIDIKAVGFAPYYGITLKTDDHLKRRLIHEDFTILSNCGKWQRTDIYSTVMKYIPCTSDELRRKIGLLFVPTTVEDLDQGGEEYVKLFESSVPSLMKMNPNGKTATELVALFIPAYEGLVFDEYGRSIVDDPDPALITLGEDGKKIVEGAKTMLSKERLSKQSEEDRIEEIRKYPWTWFEAKMAATFHCQFNAQILTKRLQELYAMKRMPWIRGNYQWKEQTDGDVEFVRDDISGRFQVAWQPDMEGGQFENNNKIINNVGFEWNEGRKLWFPKNDRLFSAGADPIAYKAKGIDPRLSKGAAHIFRKFDPAVDQGKDIAEWQSYNFVVQYLFRPDTFEMYGEDMIKMLRFWGCSINAEDNVQSLRQYFDSRGYGSFIMYRRDFDNKSIMGNGDLDRPMRSNIEVIDTYTNKLNTWFFRHGMRCLFPEMLEQGLQFDPNDTQRFDCIVSAGYTIVGAEKRQESDFQEDLVDITTILPVIGTDGWKKVSGY